MWLVLHFVVRELYACMLSLHVGHSFVYILIFGTFKQSFIILFCLFILSLKYSHIKSGGKQLWENYVDSSYNHVDECSVPKLPTAALSLFEGCPYSFGTSAIWAI